MPIRKIPIVHSLAVISQTHQKEIQDRLRRSEGSTEASRKIFHAVRWVYGLPLGHSHLFVGICNLWDFLFVAVFRNPFEVTEEFVENFNHAQIGQEQERYIRFASQLFKGIKVCMWCKSECRLHVGLCDVSKIFHVVVGCRPSLSFLHRQP